MHYNREEMFIRIVKYMIMGLTVGIVASMLPDYPLSLENTLLLGITSAAMFSVLDLIAPSICFSTAP